MTNRFAVAAERMTTRFKDHGSETVVLSDKGYSISLLSWIGRTQKELVDGNGNVIEWDSVDFMVAAEDLVLSGKQVEPKRGMKITRTVQGVEEVYSVEAPGNEQHFQVYGPNHEFLRIHTKRIAAK